MSTAETAPARLGPLAAQHREQGAKMVDFAGWSMPLSFGGIIEEHRHCREHAVMFDVSHMGRLRVRGTDADSFLDGLCSRRIADMEYEHTRYSLLCRPDGGILDDVMVSRFTAGWLLVCNAANRDKVLKWLIAHVENRKVQIIDETFATAMLAIQGPQSLPLLQRRMADLLTIPLEQFVHRRAVVGNYMFVPFTLFRGGYTGEDGVELILPPFGAKMAWNYLVKKDLPDGTTLQPAGLGARDTLRLEAGLPLYGHELSEDIDPFTAGLAFAVNLDHDFIGRDALQKISDRGPQKKRVGLELTGRRIARPGTKVLDSQNEIGEVTSGTFSPTLAKSIAMAYVDAAAAQPGTELTLQIPNDRLSAKIVPLPFYRRYKNVL